MVNLDFFSFPHSFYFPSRSIPNEKVRLPGFSYILSGHLIERCTHRLASSNLDIISIKGESRNNKEKKNTREIEEKLYKKKKIYYLLRRKKDGTTPIQIRVRQTVKFVQARFA